MPTPESRELFEEEQIQEATVQAARQAARLSPSSLEDVEDQIDFSDETPAQRADTKRYDDARKEIMRISAEIKTRSRALQVADQKQTPPRRRRAKCDIMLTVDRL